MKDNVAIKVKNLSKSYKMYSNHIDRFKESIHPLKKKYHHNFFALNDVSFEVKKGEVVGIIGRNGSGKSTLLKMITGVLTPTSGSIEVFGRISAILELGGSFNPEYTGVENIYLYGMLNGFSRDDMEAKLDTILEFANIGEHIYQPVSTYSSGMSARLAFAVSINVEPDILIVDEALAVGDAAFQRKCFAKMEEIKNSGATIFFVSHDEQSVVKLCDRAIWLSKGNYVVDGLPKLVTTLYMKYFDETKIDNTEIEKEFKSLISSQKKEEQKSTDDKHSNLKNSVKEAGNVKAIGEFYNPLLKPHTTIYYEEKGASISNIRITNIKGIKVNVLARGSSYSLKYNIDFAHIDCAVIVGMSLHTKDGVCLVTGNYPSPRNFLKINSKSVTVSWNFECFLLQGEYFITVGIMKDDGVFMARIKDAVLIKVVEDGQGQAIGMVDLKLEGDMQNV